MYSMWLLARWRWGHSDVTFLGIKTFFGPAAPFSVFCIVDPVTDFSYYLLNPLWHVGVCFFSSAFSPLWCFACTATLKLQQLVISKIRIPLKILSMLCVQEPFVYIFSIQNIELNTSDLLKDVAFKIRETGLPWEEIRCKWVHHWGKSDLVDNKSVSCVVLHPFVTLLPSSISFLLLLDLLHFVF